MLTFSFFTAVFLTISWVMYIGTYIYARLNGVSLTALGLTDLAIYTALAIIPLFVLWGIWGSIYRFRREKTQQKQFKMVEAQFKQNQELLEIVARMLYQGQQSRQNHFILGQTELFINELNGLIADMLQRYNFISDSEAAKLWTTAEKGNKWGFAKALINLQHNSIDFENRLYRLSAKENILRGTINEFCARYARLLDILKKYDQERIFLDIIETGAFGKAFAILAPLADRLQENVPAKPGNSQQDITQSESTEPRQENISELFAEIDMRIDFPEKTEKKAKPTENIIFESEPENNPDPLADLDEIKIDELTNETADVEEGRPEPVVQLAAETEIEDILADLDNQKTPEEFDEEESENKPENVIIQPESPVQEKANPKKPNIEEEISSMFAGAGVRGDDEDDIENPDKTFFFPKFGNLFKRRNTKEKNTYSQDEIDPLTLALERSFGKLSDSAPASNSRLSKIMEAEEKNAQENTESSGKKFAFASTNETILKLQQELEQLKNPTAGTKTKDGTMENAEKKDI